MNEIRQLCTNSISMEKNLDQIFELFHSCPTEQVLPSLSLICQSISCMTFEQFTIDIFQHPIFLLIRQWSERLFENWFNHQTLTSEEYRTMFYIHQLFKLMIEWFNEQTNDRIESMMKTFFLNESFLRILSRVIQRLIEIKEYSDDDILEILYRSVNALVTLYSHENLINQSMVNEYLSQCIFECLNESLILFDQNLNIRTRFLLFTCLDYLIQSNMSRELFPSIYQIFQIWSETPNEEISLLIIRLIRYLNQYSFHDREVIIRENFCAFLRPHFELLCQNSNLIDDLVSLLINLSSIPLGKEHLRELDFVSILIEQVKYHIQFFHPLALLLIQQDLYQSSFLKRLIHLLIIRTNQILQTLTSTINDTSFDSISPLSKNQLSINAIEWFILLRTQYLCFNILIDELIQSTKKLRLIPILIETIVALEQEEDIPENLIEVMMEFLWTLTFSLQTKIIDYHSNLSIWLKNNLSSSTIRLMSQAILFIIEPNTRITLPIISNQLICMITTDEFHYDLCVTLRDRLQIEQHYSVELIVTSKCQSFGSLIQFIHRSSLCLFCTSKSMKSDNLAHFVSYYLTIQSSTIPILSIGLEHDLELDGNWLENLSLIDMPSILKEIRRYIKPLLSTSSKRLNDHYTQRSVNSWTTNDVNQWWEATQGRFESLRPLVMRLNGPALVHLAEILASEPAAMYHSLNDELLQRTGSTVPLTEYASLCSELQRLIRMKSNTSSTNVHSTTKKKKKKLSNTHFCTLF